MDLAEVVEAGPLTLQPVDPAELSPASSPSVRRAVEGNDGRRARRSW